MPVEGEDHGGSHCNMSIDSITRTAVQWDILAQARKSTAVQPCIDISKTKGKDKSLTSLQPKQVPTNIAQ